jgi:hypothetical protein
VKLDAAVYIAQPFCWGRTGRFMLFGTTNGKQIKLQLIGRTVLIFNHMCGA